MMEPSWWYFLLKMIFSIFRARPREKLCKNISKFSEVNCYRHWSKQDRIFFLKNKMDLEAAALEGQAQAWQATTSAFLQGELAAFQATVAKMQGELNAKNQALQENKAENHKNCPAACVLNTERSIAYHATAAAEKLKMMKLKLQSELAFIQSGLHEVKVMMWLAPLNRGDGFPLKKMPWHDDKF